MTDAPDQLVAIGQAAFVAVAAAIESQGLIRDPDRGTVETDAAGKPSLASWSGADGDLREVDYHHDTEAGIAWLAVRGDGAEHLAKALAVAFGGRPAGTVEEMLAALMVPSAATRRLEKVERDGGRWQMLQAAIETYSPANALLVRSMIRAGLLDADWRVRMTAMLAIGRLRLTDLAPQAMAVKVPEAGKAGVSQADRRILLALRHASHDFACGLLPSAGPGDSADADVATLRRNYQASLHRLLAGDDIDDVRVKSLFFKLLGTG